jgi:hypothetical protein
MITIDALGKDGNSILFDLAGASPTGGFVTSESRPGRTLMPGDLVRDMGGWHVVTDVRHNGITGMTHAMHADFVGQTSTLLLAAGQSVEVRTDTRIDPDTLWKLQAGAAAASLCMS